MANEGALFAADVSREGHGGAGHRPVTDREHADRFGKPAGDFEAPLGNVEEVEEKSPRKPAMRRLNLNLPATLYDDLSELAESQGKSMTEVVRTGLGLAHIAYTQIGKRQKLIIADADGKPIREILIPK